MPLSLLLQCLAGSVSAVEGALLLLFVTYTIEDRMKRPSKTYEEKATEAPL